MLTPLLTKVVKGVQVSMQRDYGLQGSGGLVTTVIRAMKAWAKHGFTHEQQHGTSSTCSTSSSDGASHSGCTASNSAAVTPPPGFIWEIFVIFVLKQKLEQFTAAHANLSAEATARYSTGGQRELNLFMDVLQAASELLHPAVKDGQSEPAPIALTEFYTADECELFRSNWGPPSPLHLPLIIHPADPSFNCGHQGRFKDWEALASAAGRLHGQLQEVLQQGQQPGDVDAWQLVLSRTSLGAAVRAFESS